MTFACRVSKCDKSNVSHHRQSRDGRNPLLVPASLRECANRRDEGERSTRVVSRAIPGRVSDNAPSSPSPSPFRPRKHRRVKKPMRSRRPLSHDSSYDRYRFPFQSLFCLLLDLSSSPPSLRHAVGFSPASLVQDSR